MPPRSLIHRILFVLGVLSGLMAPTPAAAEFRPTQTQRAFLEELSRRSFLYFWEQADPATGLVRDAAGADGRAGEADASVAAIGFALTGYCIADERGWVPAAEIEARVLATLRFLADECETVRGFYYHFIGMETRRRAGGSELSSIDTALLLGGVLTARAHFDNPEIHRLATHLYERVDWPWMQSGGATLAMGWTPEAGFTHARWAHYDESMLLYLLAIGSPTHPIPSDSWEAVSRSGVINYGGRVFIACSPLFTHQYSHAWVDFEHQRDHHADYWQNSRLATLAQQQHCADLSRRFPAYSERLWGLSAGLGEDGYFAWGGPPTTARPAPDGTVVPYAAAGSIPFAPEASIPTLMHMVEAYGDRVWRRYGLTGAFNPHTGWFADDVLGIDVGITLLMIENHRSRFVWDTFHRNPEIDRAMAAVGFRPLPERGRSADRKSSVYGITDRPDDLRRERQPVALAWRSETHEVVAIDWHRVILPEQRSARFAFTWNDAYLVAHFQLVLDDAPRNPHAFPDHLDGIEVFFDPAADGLSARDPQDLRLVVVSPERAGLVGFTGGSAQPLRTDAQVRNGRLHLRVFIPWAAIDGFEPDWWRYLRVNPVFRHDDGRSGWHQERVGGERVLGRLVLGGEPDAD